MRVRACLLAAMLAGGASMPAADEAGGSGGAGWPVPVLDVIAVWIERNFGLPAAAEPPRIALASPETLTRLRHGPDAGVAPGGVAGVYVDRERTIYLEEGWDGRSPADLSVLVHEMVHHLQGEAGVRFSCPGEREGPAYAAQAAWLEMFGLSLAGEFGIDPMTLLLRTSCAY